MNSVTGILTALAACLCRQIESDGLPEPCFCGVLPGDRVAVDYVGNCEAQDGMAYVRLITSYPAAGVGRVDTTPNNCSAGLGIEIEIGILRTAPTMQVDGNPPDEGDQLASADLQYGDMLAMYKAVQCCFADTDRPFIIGTYRPTGPMGYAVGGTLNVMVAM